MEEKMEDRILKTIDDGNWCEFLDTPVAVLFLSVSTCPACAAWEDELQTWIAGERRWLGVRIGKVILDSPTVADFKRDNEWLDEVPGLPFTAVFVNGEPRTSFAGGGVSRLERRLENLELPLEEHFSGAASMPLIRESGAQAPRTAHNAH
jgi:hypothetical protein